MKKNIFKLSLILSIASITTSVFADSHTLSLGYAQTKIEDNLKIRGVQTQYRYEFDSPLSLVGTLSYQTGDDKFEDFDEIGQIDVKHLSLLAGPAYRINEFFSVYGVIGLANTKVDSSLISTTDYDKYELSETALAYGAGLILNPTSQTAINVGYEATKIDDTKFTGFNISFGYKF
jgi:putatice virulence related protein PagC